LFVARSLFQALGNMLPSLLAPASRIVLFAVPALLIACEPWVARNGPTAGAGCCVF
jgi:hypothetical protein